MKKPMMRIGWVDRWRKILLPGSLCFAGMLSGAESVARYVYEATLDGSPRAQREDCKFWAYATQGEFRRLQEKYNAEAFDEWVKKLALVREGMTFDEVERVLKPKKISQWMIYGAGISTTIELDDAYVVYGMFHRKEGLQGKLSAPVAITYGVRWENLMPEGIAQPTSSPGK